MTFNMVLFMTEKEMKCQACAFIITEVEAVFPEFDGFFIFHFFALKDCLGF